MIGAGRAALRAAWQSGDYAAMFPDGQYRNQTYVLDAGCTQMAMLGIHGQFAFIDLDRDLLAVGYGSYPTQVDAILVESLRSLWSGLREVLS